MRIKIYLGFIRRRWYAGTMKQMKFSPKTENGCHFFQKHLADDNREELRKIARFCRWRWIHFSVTDDSMERSTDYRKNFFAECKGILGSDRYFCAYCGKILHRDRLVVDHIVPVHMARTSKKVKKRLARKGIKNVNDARNLTASCSKCNSRKSAKGGLWIVRGRFGRSWRRMLLWEFFWLIVGSVVLYYSYWALKWLGAEYLVSFFGDFVHVE